MDIPRPTNQRQPSTVRHVNIGWTRGEGCQTLASLLAEEPTSISDDLRRSVIDNKVELLVTKKMSSFDLTSVAIPSAFDAENLTSVVAAVGGGAHSPLAAEVASTVGRSLGLPVTLKTVYRPDEQAEAEQRLARMADAFPGVKTDALESSTVRAILEGVDDSALLVVGAPGGSWLNRQLFGPGHRLIAGSAGGTITVRFSDRKVFHDTVDANGFALGARMLASTAFELVNHAVVPVADEGFLTGIVRRAELASSLPAATVADLMEDPVSLLHDEPLHAAGDLDEHMEGSPIPVTDSDGRLVGVLPVGGTMLG